MVGESRSELLTWLNTTLDLDYKKVEQCGSGAVYCQLIDSIYGDIPMSRVNFTSKSEYDYLNNMKILQSGFSKHKITKNIDVDKLVKCRLQDNLELLQWFKKYWMENKDLNVEYDAKLRRNKRVASRNGIRPSSSASSVTSTPGGKERSTSSVSSVNANNSTGNIGNRSVSSTLPGKRVMSNPLANKTSLTREKDKELHDVTQQLNIKQQEIELLTQSNHELLNEKTFYFGKLRNIEVLITNALETIEQKQVVDAEDILKEIRFILYQREEGFTTDDIDIDQSEVLDNNLDDDLDNESF